MNPGRRLLILLAGAAAGAVLSAVVVFGEGQIRLAAAGGFGTAGSPAVVLVDPQWATVIAFAVALVAVGLGLLTWELARGRVTRSFWLAVLVSPIAVVALGTPLAPAMFDPSRRGGGEELLANAAHSSLLFAVIVGAAIAAVTASPATTGAPRGRPGGVETPSADRAFDRSQEHI